MYIYICVLHICIQSRTRTHTHRQGPRVREHTQSKTGWHRTQKGKQERCDVCLGRVTYKHMRGGGDVHSLCLNWRRHTPTPTGTQPDHYTQSYANTQTHLHTLTTHLGKTRRVVMTSPLLSIAEDETIACAKGHCVLHIRIHMCNTPYPHV